MKRLLAVFLLLFLGSSVFAESKVIEDMAGWRHPVKQVFLKYKITPLKVELFENQTYPVFHVRFSADLTRATRYQFYDMSFEVAAANGFWGYTIEDAPKGIKIIVTCDKSAKTLNSVEFLKDGKTFFKRDKYEDEAARIAAAEKLLIKKLNAKYYKETDDYTIDGDDSVHVIFCDRGLDEKGRYVMTVNPSDYPLSIYDYYHIDIETQEIEKE